MQEVINKMKEWAAKDAPELKVCSKKKKNEIKFVTEQKSLFELCIGEKENVHIFDTHFTREHFFSLIFFD